MRAYRAFLAAILGVTAATTTLLPADARACGGGVVGEAAQTDVSVAGQRVFVSVRKAGLAAADIRTDIVTQLEVDGGGDFGVLLPLPAAPTLDTTPVDAKELAALDSATQVRFVDTDT